MTEKPKEKQSNLLFFLNSEQCMTSKSVSVTSNEAPPDEQQQHCDATPSTSSVTVSPVATSKRKRHFQVKWQINRHWLKFDDNKNFMFCQLCREFDRKKMSTFVDGSSTFKLDTIVKHEHSEIHKTSVIAEKAQRLAKTSSTAILEGFQRMSEAELCLYQKLFRTAFFVAKTNKPFTDYPKLCELQSTNFNSINVTQYYCSNKQCKTFVSFIAENYMQSVRETVQKSEFFALISDGSTDSAVIEEEIMYVRVLNERYEPCVKFIAFKEIEKADAPGLKAAAIDALQNDLQIKNWEKSLVVVCVDGASVNLGIHKGFVALLTKEHAPHLLGMHCTAHRLELAIKDAAKSVPYMATVDEFLQTLYTTYHNSALMWAGLKETAKALNETAYKPVCVWGTRWVAHRQRAVDVVLKEYSVLTTHLHQVSISGSGEKAAKCKGLFKTLTSLKFLIFLHSFQYFLSTCASLSVVLQQNSTDLEKLEIKVVSTLSKLENFDVRKRITDFSKSHIENSKFKGIEVIDTKARTDKSKSLDTEEKVSVDIDKLVSCTVDCIKHRFGGVNDKIFQNFRIFNPKHWPKDEKSLSDFGKEEIQALVFRYKDILENKGYDSDVIQIEWQTLIIELRIEYGTDNLAGMSSSTLWPQVLRDEDKRMEFKNVLALVKIMMTIPVSSAEAERGFSYMARVKTDYRSRLGSNVLSHLMQVNMSNDSIQTFDPKPAVLLWWKGGKVRRRLVKKYGPRASRSDSDSSSSESEAEE